MSLHFTAANLSRIRKPGAAKKNPLSPLKPKPSKPPKPADPEPPRLQVLNHNVQMDFDLRGSASVADAIDTIVANQWAERSVFHARYYSKETKAACSAPEDLLFLMRGLLMETKASILKYRALQLPAGGMVTVNQLYSVFEARGHTFVDRSLELNVRDGVVRRFVITNALPVILSAKGNLQKTTYGYENTEVVVRAALYLHEIECAARADAEAAGALTKFRQFVEDNPAALFATNNDFAAPELTVLVKTGFLTLTSNHHNEIDIHQYSIAYPRCGTFLKMINAGRAWLVRTLTRAAFKEALEEALLDKWEGKNLASFRKPFYGYDLLWLLADARGAGVVEVFNTPVGRGWRLTGKL